MKDFFFPGVTTIAEEDLIQTVLEMSGLIMADSTMVDSTMADSTMVDSTMVDSTMAVLIMVDSTSTMGDSTMVDLITTMADSTMADLTTMADWILDVAVNADLIYFLSQMAVFKETVELLTVQVKTT